MQCLHLSHTEDHPRTELMLRMAAAARTKKHPYCYGVPNQINIPFLCSCSLCPVWWVCPLTMHIYWGFCVPQSKGSQTQQHWCLDQDNTLRCSRLLRIVGCSECHGSHSSNPVGLSLSPPTSGQKCLPGLPHAHQGRNHPTGPKHHHYAATVDGTTLSVVTL